ncbi:MAG TPA: trypsin-like serine protease [Vicinamibacterales bacterium]|nr:trypsin-like serine protease [Vicinamibacterales bacterium]
MGDRCGEQPVEPPDPDLTLLGTVQIHCPGHAPCAGTLQSNAWVLTADHCIPEDCDPYDMEVVYGGDLLNPVQACASEIVRFADPPGGSVETRDLALVRLSQPLSIGGSTTGFRRPVFPYTKESLQDISLYCVGWDLDSEPGSADTTQTTQLTTKDFESGIQGTVLWLQKEVDGAITQAADEGGGCFIQNGPAEWFQVGIQLDNPATGPAGEVNDNVWSRVASLTDHETRNWMLRTMLGQETVPGIVPTLGINAIVLPDGELELLWIDANGKLFAAPLTDPASAVELGSPSGVTFVSQRPAGIVFGEEIFVASLGSDQQLWYRRLGTSPSESVTDWTVVESTTTTPASGAALVAEGGNLHLLARDSSNVLRYAAFLDEWSAWQDLGGDRAGAPSASSWGPGRIDIMMRTIGTGVWMIPRQDGVWGTQVDAQSYASAYTSYDPLVVDSGGFEVDMWVRDISGNLRLRIHNWGWLDQWLDPRIQTGKYIAGVSRSFGTYDLFLSDGTTLNHLTWPR